MKRFLPIVLALGLSAMAILMTTFLLRGRVDAIRAVTGRLRELDEEVQPPVEPGEALR
jgi:hypothetical protein